MSSDESTTDETSQPSANRRRKRWIVAGVAAAVAAALAVSAPTLLRMAAQAEARDSITKAFDSAAESPLGGFAVNSKGQTSRTGGGYGPGDVQAFGNDPLLSRAEALTSLGRAEDFDPLLLLQRTEEREADCPSTAAGSQVRLKRIDETLTFTGCAASGAVSNLKVWRGDRELDTSFTTWFSREGLDFLRGFAIDGAATDRLYQLEITPQRVSMALVDPGRPEACVVNRWTWFVDADGVSLDTLACEKAAKDPFGTEPLSAADFASYATVGDWDPSASLEAMTDALTAAGAAPEARLESARLTLAGPSGDVPVLTASGGGHDAVVPLLASDQPRLEAAEKRAPDVLGTPWPERAAGWTLTATPPGPIGEAGARYRKGETTVTATMLPREPLPPNWYAWLTENTHPGTNVGDATCGGPLSLSLPFSMDSCHVPVARGALIVSTEKYDYDGRDAILPPMGELATAIVKEVSK